MPETYMRPTAVLVKRKNADPLDAEVFMIGGHKDRLNQVYSVKYNTWNFIPKVPEGHNITTTVCVNWKEKVIFTVMLDAKMNIKMAYIDLENLKTSPTAEGYNEIMQWCLRLPQEQHKIDRFHVKCAITMPDGKIAVLARGRVEGMKEQIKTLIVYFRVDKTPEGYRTTLDKYQEVFPTVFPRQLDFIQRNSNTILNV